MILDGNNEGISLDKEQMNWLQKSWRRYLPVIMYC